MKRRKPRGINGVVTLDNGVDDTGFVPTLLPDDKAAIELTICAGALRAMRTLGWTTWPQGIEPRQLAESDFDFAFDLADCTEYLDLSEVAPLEGVKGGYEGLPTRMTTGRHVDAILALVRKKAEHYRSRSKLKVHLLLYTTDFRLLASHGSVALLKMVLRRDPPRFASVSYYAPIQADSGLLHVLFPAPDGVPYLSVDDERKLRAGEVINCDPRKWETVSEKLPRGVIPPEWLKKGRGAV
jgi:hypothetical protein